MLPILLGAAAALSFVGLLASEHDVYEEAKEPDNTVFTYYDIEKVSDALSKRGLTLSTPVPITDHTISQYCAYYDKTTDQLESFTYCTTSGIADSNGITVGNVNLGGSIHSPVVAIAVLDPVPSVDSGRGHAVGILEGVIESLVCECWEDEEPGGFESVHAWMREAESVLAAHPEPTPLKAEILGFADVDITLEAIAISEGGYQWTLVIQQ